MRAHLLLLLVGIAALANASDDRQVADSRILASQTYLTDAERAAVFNAFGNVKVSTYTLVDNPQTFIGLTTDDAAASFPDAIQVGLLGATPTQEAYMDSTSAPGDHTTLDMVSRTTFYIKALTAP